MFAFDQAQLPKVNSRRAFVGVDFQNDFTSKSGALAATEPHGYVERAVKLAEAFRSCGNTVIWTQTQPGPHPIPSDEQIMASDSPSSVAHRSRRRLPKIDPSLAGPADPEAFLSHDEPSCLKPDTSGMSMTAQIKDAIPSSDLVLTKTGYSAFKDTQLLRILRSKMVMELFICGSLANIGVYATAIDAAGHGMAINIVDDCCGYRSETRQSTAFSRLSDLTGCEMLSAQEVSKTLTPATGKAIESVKTAPRDRASRNGTESNKKTNETADLDKELSKLRLETDAVKSKSPTPKLEERPVGSSRNESGAEQEGASQSSEHDPKSSRNSAHVKDPSNHDKPDTTGIRNPGARSQNDTEVEPLSEMLSSKLNLEHNTSTFVETTDSTKDRPADVTINSQTGVGAGDTDVIDGILPEDLEKDVFENLKNEVRWQRMSHQGGEVPRLVAVQGEVGEDGSIPIYRHPSDESPPLLPFTPLVRAIKAETEKQLGHELNHVLIQFYRDGNDYISEHSDKTIDVVKGSYIANVSLGAQRTMVLRTKRDDRETSHAGAAPQRKDDQPVESKPAVEEDGQPQHSRSEPLPRQNGTKAGDQTHNEDSSNYNDGQSAPTNSVGTKRQVQRLILRHNSLCRMGLQTNMKWLHSIRQDKRADRDKSAAELAFDGGRISLTFRRIGTFLSQDERLIWGQGATGKTSDEAHAVINGESPEMVQMLKAFGKENHSSSFDWSAHYGKGFDVLHMSSSPRFFACRDALVNSRIALMLAEYGVGYAKGSMTASKTCNLDDDQLEAASVKFVDADALKSVVQGDMAIMLYLETCYGPSPKTKDDAPSKPDVARHLTMFQKALTFLVRWRAVQKSAPGKAPDLKLLSEELTVWESFASSSNTDTGFLEGSAPGLADFALWPVVNDVIRVCGSDGLDDYVHLKAWFERFAARDSVMNVMPRTKT